MCLPKSSVVEVVSFPRQYTRMRVLVLLSCLLPSSVVLAAPAARDLSGAELCLEAVAAAERTQGTPARLLGAISRVESGRVDPSTGSVRPWPWTINAEGQGRVFAVKADAIAAVQALEARGVRSVDVGCMQVNLMYHPDAFRSLEEAFNPPTNAKYAARFLTALHRELGTWDRAAAAYHSQTGELGTGYASKVMAVWGRPMPVGSPPAAERPAGGAGSAYAAFAAADQQYPCVRAAEHDVRRLRRSGDATGQLAGLRRPARAGGRGGASRRISGGGSVCCHRQLTPGFSGANESPSAAFTSDNCTEEGLMRAIVVGLVAAGLSFGVAGAQTSSGSTATGTAPGAAGTGTGGATMGSPGTGTTGVGTGPVINRPALSGPGAASGNNNQAVATTNANAPQPAKGSNSFTMGEARSRIEKEGFTNVTDLKKDDFGVWRGHGKKNGQTVSVWLDYKGNVGQ